MEKRGFFDQKSYIEESTWKRREFSIIEITLKKVRGKNVDFSTSDITPKKVPGNDMDFSTIEITSKKYMEMTWKFIEISSLTYRHNIDVESAPIRCGVAIGVYHHLSRPVDFS